MFASRVRHSSFAACLALYSVALATTLAEESKTVDAKADPLPWLVPRGRDTTFVDGPYADDGLPDYVEALNRLASQGVTPENNAVVALVEVFGLVGSRRPFPAIYFTKLGISRPTPGAADRYHDYYDSKETVVHPETEEEEDKADQVWRAAETVWSEKDLPLAAKALRENQAALDRIVVASRRTHWYDPYVETDEFSISGEENIDHLFVADRLHGALFLLRARALQRASKGDADGALSDLSAALRFTRLLDRAPTGMERVFAYFWKQFAGRAIAVALHHGQFDEKEITPWITLWKSQRAFAPLASAATGGERLFALHHFARIARSPSLILGGVRKRVWFARVALDIVLRRIIDWESTFRATNRWYDLSAKEIDIAPTALDEMLRAASGRSLETLRRAASEFDRTEASKSLADVLVSLQLPNVVHTKLERDKICELVDVSLVLATYRARHNAYPESLKALGEAGKEIPGEAGGQLFRYERTEEGYRLWSRGQDEEFDTDTFDEDELNDDVFLEVP